jgi:hypothetical protein
MGHKKLGLRGVLVAHPVEEAHEPRCASGRLCLKLPPIFLQTPQFLINIVKKTKHQETK